MHVTLIVPCRATVLEAQSQILGCEACSPAAEIPFDWILDEVTGRKSSEADYVLSEPAKCPKCLRELTEKTLVAEKTLLESS